MLSAKMRMYEDLVEFGVEEELKKEYGELLTTPEVCRVGATLITIRI